MSIHCSISLLPFFLWIKYYSIGHAPDSSTMRRDQLQQSCPACDHISHADHAQADAQTAEQNLNPNHRPAKHVPEEEEVEEEDYKLCHLHLRTIYARLWTVKCMGCKCTLAALGRTQSKMPSMLALIFLGFWLLGMTGTPRCTFHFRHTCMTNTACLWLHTQPALITAGLLLPNNKKNKKKSKGRRRTRDKKCSATSYDRPCC